MGGQLCAQVVEVSFVSAWLTAWRTWLKKPANTANSRPGKIDLRPYLCKHNLLLVDLNFPGDKAAFEIISEGEWDALVEKYVDTTMNIARLAATGSFLQLPNKAKQKYLCRSSYP